MSENKRECQITIDWLNNLFLGHFEIDGYRPDGRPIRLKLGYIWDKPDPYKNEYKQIPNFRFMGYADFNRALTFAEELITIYHNERIKSRVASEDYRAQKITELQEENSKLAKSNTQLQAKVNATQHRLDKCKNIKMTAILENSDNKESNDV